MDHLSTFFGQVQEVCGHLFNSAELIATLSRPEFTIAAFVVLTTVVFTETGLLIGFFLPGDSLLVTVGLVCASPACEWNLALLLALLCAAAIIGDSVGYTIGFKTGPRIFSREQSLLFHKDHLLKAQEFYERHGGKTIILARFMPIIRTFAPVVAGVGRMNYRQFLFFNVIGGVGWVCSMVLMGYFLPTLINPPMRRLLHDDGFRVENHLEKVVIIVVLLSISPGIIAWIRARLNKAPKPALAPELQPVEGEKAVY
jgi:membrane-associated protein